MKEFAKVFRAAVISIIALLGSASVGASESIIIWTGAAPLEWSDFEAPPPPIDEAQVHAFATTGITLSWVQNPLTGGIAIEINAFFNRAASWYRPALVTADTLDHERGHFDMAEYWARQLRQALAESDDLVPLLSSCEASQETIDAVIGPLYQNVYDSLTAQQDQYDVQTFHGLEAGPQSDYDDLFNTGLTELASYANPNLAIDPASRPEPSPGTHVGYLRYQLSTFSEAPYGEYEWEIAGVWQISVEHDGNTAQTSLSHISEVNNYTGSLTNVTDPAVPGFSDLATPILETDGFTDYYVDFSSVAGPSPNLHHELTFESSYPAVEPFVLKFPSVATIALGHWMRTLGNATMKAKAPITCQSERAWAIDLDDGRSLKLRWQLD